MIFKSLKNGNTCSWFSISWYRKSWVGGFFRQRIFPVDGKNLGLIVLCLPMSLAKTVCKKCQRANKPYCRHTQTSYIQCPLRRHHSQVKLSVKALRQEAARRVDLLVFDSLIVICYYVQCCVPHPLVGNRRCKYMIFSVICKIIFNKMLYAVSLFPHLYYFCYLYSRKYTVITYMEHSANHVAVRRPLLDVHTHTVVSGHAYSSLQEMARAAADKGIEVLGITEHGPSIPGTCPDRKSVV